MDTSTLRGRFTLQMLIVLIIVGILTGCVQLWFYHQKIHNDVSTQARMISESIRQGIKETDMAASAIEHQIDLKLEAYAQRIGDRLYGKSIDRIDNEELLRIRDEMGLAGITLFVLTEDDIVGAKSTEANEIGFSIKGFNPYAYELFRLFAEHKPLPEEAKAMTSYLTDTMLNLYITQSGSHGDDIRFFKYGYYKPPGADYIIDPYIEADEVYRFTRDVGPEAWIDQILGSNKNALEIGLLNPAVYKDPSLAETMYPPLTKVVNGTYTMENDRDRDILSGLADVPSPTAYISVAGDKRVYKAFIPLRDDRVLYIALDYGRMAMPLYRSAMLLIGSSLVSLLALFMLTTRFFNRIYLHIQRIMKQISELQSGDLTAKSEVNDSGELGRLSRNANEMADSLHYVLSDTFDKANQVQRLAFMLETEANDSAEKAFALSMETTVKARESVEEVEYFLDEVGKRLRERLDHHEADQLLEQFDRIRTMIHERSKGVAEITISLSDLLRSLHGQSSELAEIADSLMKKLDKFTL